MPFLNCFDTVQWTILEQGGQINYVTESLKCLILGGFHRDISTIKREVEPKAISFALQWIVTDL
jgi:hypothetical protein